MRHTLPKEERERVIVSFSPLELIGILLINALFMFALLVAISYYSSR
jgi:hypothetical protein